MLGRERRLGADTQDRGLARAADQEDACDPAV